MRGSAVEDMATRHRVAKTERQIVRSRRRNRVRGRPGWSLKISEINNIRNVSPQMIQEARSLIKIPHREHASPELLTLPPCAPWHSIKRMKRSVRRTVTIDHTGIGVSDT